MGKIPGTKLIGYKTHLSHRLLGEFTGRGVAMNRGAIMEFLGVPDVAKAAHYSMHVRLRDPLDELSMEFTLGFELEVWAAYDRTFRPCRTTRSWMPFLRHRVYTNGWLGIQRGLYLCDMPDQVLDSSTGMWLPLAYLVGQMQMAVPPARAIVIRHQARSSDAGPIPWRTLLHRRRSNGDDGGKD